MQTVVRVTDVTNVVELADALTEAFEGDLVARYIFPDDSSRRARLRRFFTMQLRSFYLRRGEIYATPQFNGAALWVPPRFRGPVLADVLAEFPLFCLMLLQARPMLRLAQLLARHHPLEPHYYLGTIGVDPKHQGEGIGSALLAAVLEVCDRDEIPAYLEASSQENVVFYQHRGFRVTDTVALPDDGPTIWMMCREPVGATAAE